jgi:chromosome partitioning protein
MLEWLSQRKGMGAIITISNQKGGVGKTVFAVNLAEYAWEKGARVLVVDVDGQGNSTRYFIEERAPYRQGASLLYEDGPSPVPVSVRERLALIAADKALNDVDALADADERIVLRPRTHLARLAADYDVVVIDTPPTQSRRLLGALVAADAVVTPIAVDRASFEGLVDVLGDLRAVRAKWHPELRHIGILVNRFRQMNRHQRENLAELRAQFGTSVLAGELDDRSPVGASFDARRPVWKGLNGESAIEAAKQFRAACQLVLERAYA